jgi:hypothetical protein
VILYFSNRLDQVQKDLSVGEVLTTIQHGALQWPKERLKVRDTVESLKYKYMNMTSFTLVFILKQGGIITEDKYQRIL